MSDNSNLGAAKRAKNDEFYTQLTDIEKELRHYRKHFKGKTVLCNCDDPTWSAFWKYFHLNFSALGLKKLISTHYDKNEPTYEMEYTGGDDNDIEVGVKTPLEGDGDFRSEECLALLDEADIVVTNPPFSLFREYVAVLMKHQKKFIIVGNMNAITYKEIFPLIKDGLVWLGVSRLVSFVTPEGMTKGVQCRWFTNLDIKKRHEELILVKKYAGHENEYPTYDNYDAIEVSKVTDIPFDYDGVMGVPITFLDKYSPEQFGILGMSASVKYNCDIVGIPFLGEADGRPLLNGKNTYARILIRNKHPQFEIVGISGDLANPLLIDGERKTGRFYINGRRLYDRIVIRNKYPEQSKDVQ